MPPPFQNPESVTRMNGVNLFSNELDGGSLMSPVDLKNINVPCHYILEMFLSIL